MAQSATESLPKEEYVSDDAQETTFSSHCCCFHLNFPCFMSARSHDWERISIEDRARSSWCAKRMETLKKLREWSKVAAGPKWKTFIRRFNNKTAFKAKPAKFQYDPLSYSLNFDEGMGQNGQAEADVVFRDFSSRYAAIPATNAQFKEGA